MADETAAQLFARLGAKQSLGTLDLPLFSTLPSSPGGGLCPGDVVEMTGGEGSGKTEMLLNITAQCVLPRWWGGREVGGKAVEVVWVSTDHKFDVLRLAAILEVKLHRSDRAAGQGKERGMARAVTDITDVDFEGLISTCLSRVHVLYCNSSTELAAALQSLRLSLLRQRPDVCSLVIDNVAEFYWRDRAEAGSVRGCETRQAQWVGTLRSLVEESHVVVFAAKPLLFAQQVSSNGKAGSKPSSDDVMCPQWRRLIKYRFLFTSSDIYPTHYTSKRVFPPCDRSHTFVVSTKGVTFL